MIKFQTPNFKQTTIFKSGLDHVFSIFEIKIPLVSCKTKSGLGFKQQKTLLQPMAEEGLLNDSEFVIQNGDIYYRG
jgi:hypothetical protein